MAITPNELRIGNLFDTAVGIIQIAEIPLKSNPLYNPNALHPIPLSEEWLTKFGFENYQAGFWRIKIHSDQDRYLQIPLSLKEFWDVEILIEKYREDDIELWLRAIHFVHQLQNLYFALTGKELVLSGSAKV